MNLVSQSKLALSDPVSKYLSLKNLNQGVTIEDLLNHLSGIPDYTQNPRWIKAVFDNNTPTSYDERYALIDSVMMPTGHFNYSNSNYLILEKVIEHIEGKSYGSYFNNFYMSNELDDIKITNIADVNQAFFAQDGSRSNDFSKIQEVYGLAGDVSATSAGLLKFMKFLFIKDQLLDELTKQKMLSWRSMESMVIPVGSGEINKYASGIMQLSYKGKSLIGHSGGTLKYQSFCFIHPPSETIIIALTNGAGRHYNQVFVQKMMPAILDRL